MSEQPQMLLLERLPFVASQAISRRVLRHALIQADAIVSATADDLIVQLTMIVAGRHAEDIIIQYPASWWDHFKRDGVPTFARWLRLRIRMKTHRVVAKELFPEVPLPLQGTPRIFYTETIGPIGTTGTA